MINEKYCQETCNNWYGKLEKKHHDSNEYEINYLYDQNYRTQFYEEHESMYVVYFDFLCIITVIITVMFVMILILFIT